MKIILTTKKINTPTFILFEKQFKKILNLPASKKLSIDVSADPTKVKYIAYDIAIFMSYDQNTYEAKKQNPKILTGIAGPRASHKFLYKYTNFLLVNGIEARDYYSDFGNNIFLYHLQFIRKNNKKIPLKNKKKIILGYHGNKIHLSAMYPRITDAINKIALEFDIELWAMYNIKKLGKYNFDKNILFKVKHIQYSEDNYDKYLAQCDIGLVPQLMPVKKNIFFKFLIGNMMKKYSESNNDFFLRFKETTNLGRHFVFAQYSIPVISDLSPSACKFIDHGINGYLAHHTGSWYMSIKLLIQSKKLRSKMGNNLFIKYNSSASPNIQNKNLLSFFKKLRIYN